LKKPATAFDSQNIFPVTGPVKPVKAVATPDESTVKERLCEAEPPEVSWNVPDQVP
jgi:hypothetical protein